MTISDDLVDLGSKIGFHPRKWAGLCDQMLDAGVLSAELDAGVPFHRRSFCEFLGIGESTLTGWFKSGRVPLHAKVAYGTLVALLACRGEIRRLKSELEAQARKLHVVADGERYLLIRIDPGAEDLPVGRIIARDIPDLQSAQLLAGAVPAFDLLDEALEVIEARQENTDNQELIDDLERLRKRIRLEAAKATDLQRWGEMKRPLTLDDF